jgi:hypothetical protein
MYKQKSDIITHEDIAEPGLVTDYLLKELQDVVAYTPVVISTFKKMAGELGASLKDFNLDGSKVADLKKINEQIEKANKLNIEAAKIQKIDADAKAALAKAEREQIKTDKEKITLEDKKQKQDEKKIVLTAKEIAQSQLSAQKKKDEIALLKASIVEMDKTAGSLQRVEAANARLRIERKNLDTTTIEGKRRLVELNEEINRNNKYIVENSDALKKQKLNVGNYTDSIKKAFEGTGLLGDKINQYLSIITTFAEKLEGVGDAFKANTIATEANTVVAEANITVTEAEIALEVEQTVATEANTVATEVNTVATRENAAAQGGLLKSLKALATNPYVIAIAAIAGLTKVLYENFTALDANRDKLGAATDAAKAYAETFLVVGVNSKQYAIAVGLLRLELEKLNDVQIDSILSNQQLRTAAAQAREDASEEGKTIAERVDLLDQYITKNRTATQVEIDLAQKRADAFILFAKMAASSGKELTDEQHQQVEEAKAQVFVLLEQQASETLKAQKQQVKLRKQYQDEVAKMVSETQARELESLDTFAKYKVEALKKSQKKSIEQIRNNTTSELAELKKQQSELGYIDANGIDHTAEFLAAQHSVIKKGKAEERELNRTTRLEIEQLENESNRKRLEAEKKFQEDILKLQRSKSELDNQNRKSKEDGDLAAIQSQIENNIEAVNEIKKSNKYSLSDYKQYYTTITELQDEYYALRQKQIIEAADFEKKKEADRIVDAEKAINEKYFNEKKATDKAIRDSSKSQEDADKKIAEEDVKREQRKNQELQSEKEKSAKVITGIDTNLTNATEENERKRRKAARDTNKQLTEDQKKLLEERLKREKEFVDSGLNAVASGLQKRFELQQAALDKEIDYQKRNLDIQAKLAAEGKANTLAEAQAAIDQAEERKIQAQKRAERTQQNIAIAKAFMDTLNQALQKNEPFLKAFGEASAAAGLTEAFLSRLISGSALEGTEDTGGAEGNGLDGKGGKLFMVHPNERILTKEHNKAIGGMSNEELVANAVAYKKSDFPVFNSESISTTQQTINNDLVNVMRNELQSLKKVIENKPTQSVSLNGLNEWTETIEERGLIRQVKYKQNSTRPSLRING